MRLAAAATGLNVQAANATWLNDEPAQLVVTSRQPHFQGQRGPVVEEQILVIGGLVGAPVRRGRLDRETRSDRA